MDVSEHLRRTEATLLAIDGVVGVGIGEQGGQPIIVVMVSAATPELRRQIPETLDGHPVRVDVTGEIVAF